MDERLRDHFIDNWQDFNEHCKSLILNNPSDLLAIKIKNSDISKDFIERIARDAEIVRGKSIHAYCIKTIDPLVIGFPHPKSNREELYPYERDLCLFHELSHLYYGVYFNSVFYKNSSFNYNEKEHLIEWKARQWRANPVLLKTAINSFKLKPRVYDLISFQAFYNAKKFGTKFSKDFSCPLTMWMMDPKYYYPDLNNL